MMYQDKLVAVVKCKGRILRERDRSGDGASVYLPFGSEYEISIKNLHSRKASVNISIDGSDIAGGRSVIIDANSEVSIERFIDLMDKGNRFKFIKKIKEIVEHRGDKIDDGVIRIEWQYEVPRNLQPFGGALIRSFTHNNHDGGVHYVGTPRNLLSDNIVYGNSTVFTAQVGSSTMDCCSSVLCSNTIEQSTINADEGLTVKGSVSDQQFQRGYMGALESEKHVITLMLRGTDATLNEVSEPVTVKTKLKCPTCGTYGKSDQNYCGKCASALAIAI